MKSYGKPCLPLKVNCIILAQNKADIDRFVDSRRAARIVGSSGKQYTAQINNH